MCAFPPHLVQLLDGGGVDVGHLIVTGGGVEARLRGVFLKNDLV